MPCRSSSWDTEGVKETGRSHEPASWAQRRPCRGVQRENHFRDRRRVGGRSWDWHPYQNLRLPARALQCWEWGRRQQRPRLGIAVSAQRAGIRCASLISGAAVSGRVASEDPEPRHSGKKARASLGPRGWESGSRAEASRIRNIDSFCFNATGDKRNVKASCRDWSVESRDVKQTKATRALD